jgi:hypothetical protein
VCAWPCVRGLNRRCKHGGRISPAGLARHGAGPELGVRSSHEGDFRAGPDDAGGRLHGEEPRRRSGAAAGGRCRCLGAESVTPRMDDPQERRHRVSDARNLRRKQRQSIRRTVSCWSSRPSACSSSGEAIAPGRKAAVRRCERATGRALRASRAYDLPKSRQGDEPDEPRVFAGPDVRLLGAPGEVTRRLDARVARA